MFGRYTVFEPDVIFIRTERLGIVTERNVSGPPDLVVDVLSDSTRDVDLGRKLHAYGRHRVGEYWAVDPEACAARVFFRREGEAFVDSRQGSVWHGRRAGLPRRGPEGDRHFVLKAGREPGHAAGRAQVHPARATTWR